MVRNWDIIREILLELEKSKTPDTVVNANNFNNYEEQDVAYNMRLLDEDEYIKANILSSKSGSGKIDSALARQLTNKGHDLLDTIKNNNIWEKIKEKFESKSIDMTFDLVIQVGKSLMSATLE